MGDKIIVTECMVATITEIWGPTMWLRVKEQDDGKFLVEQLWQSTIGNREWRKLPCVMKGEAH